MARAGSKSQRLMWVRRVLERRRSCPRCDSKLLKDSAVYGAYEYTSARRHLVRHFCVFCWPKIVALAVDYEQHTNRPVHINYESGTRPAWMYLPAERVLDPHDPHTPFLLDMRVEESCPEPTRHVRGVYADWLDERGDKWAGLFHRLMTLRLPPDTGYRLLFLGRTDHVGAYEWFPEAPGGTGNPYTGRGCLLLSAGPDRCYELMPRSADDHVHWHHELALDLGLGVCEPVEASVVEQVVPDLFAVLCAAAGL